MVSRRDGDRRSEALGKPVVASNQAIAWLAARVSPSTQNSDTDSRPLLEPPALALASMDGSRQDDVVFDNSRQPNVCSCEELSDACGGWVAAALGLGRQASDKP